jgi:hypothetical protein
MGTSVLHRQHQSIFMSAILSGSQAGRKGIVRGHFTEKWDEQVSRIGETIAHEEAIETPHRGSSTQRRQG